MYKKKNCFLFNKNIIHVYILRSIIKDILILINFQKFNSKYLISFFNYSKNDIE